MSCKILFEIRMKDELEMSEGLHTSAKASHSLLNVLIRRKISTLLIAGGELILYI